MWVRAEKMLIAGDSLLPNAAVVDYELTFTMPARLTADTGIDSLTHAIEALCQPQEQCVLRMRLR